MKLQKLFLLLGVLLLFNGCATHVVQQPEQVEVYVVEQSGIKYGLFFERNGVITMAPILKKIIFEKEIDRLFWKVEFKNSTKTFVKGFVQTRKVKGKKNVGSVEGFDSLVVVEIDLPVRDVGSQVTKAWFTIQSSNGLSSNGLNFKSKKINYVIRRKR